MPLLRMTSFGHLFSLLLERVRQQMRRSSARDGVDRTGFEVTEAYYEPRDDDFVVVLTARRRDTGQVVAVEIEGEDWFCLSPVRRTIEDELRSRGLAGPAPFTFIDGPEFSDGIPGGRIERRGSDDGVIITAFLAGSEGRENEENASEEHATVELPLARWTDLAPVRFAIDSEVYARRP